MQYFSNYFLRHYVYFYSNNFIKNICHHNSPGIAIWYLTVAQ